MDKRLAQIFYSDVHRICQKWEHYFPAYERHLARFRGQAVRVLEVGVSQGGSLDLWRRYFGEEARLFGVDIDPACADVSSNGSYAHHNWQSGRSGVLGGPCEGDETR